MNTDISFPRFKPVSHIVQVSGSLVPMPTTAAMDLWTCPLGEHPVTRPLPQESPLFLPLPEAQNVTENAPTNGILRPEEECLAPKTAVSRLYCYLFHAGVISEWTAMHHSVISCSVPLCQDHPFIPQTYGVCMGSQPCIFRMLILVLISARVAEAMRPSRHMEVRSGMVQAS